MIRSMKEAIHPKYYPNAKVICSCGATWNTGSTVEVLRTDVCSSCHPFFTGEQRIVDTAGQVDRYQKRMKRQSLFKADQKAREATAVRQQEEMLLNQQIEAMELSDRVRKTLMDSGIVRIGDLVEKMEAGDQELLALGGVGPKALEEVKQRMQVIGLIPDEG